MKPGISTFETEPSHIAGCAGLYERMAAGGTEPNPWPNRRRRTVIVAHGAFPPLISGAEQ